MYIYGKNPVMEALKANHNIERLFLSNNYNDLDKIKAITKKHPIEIVRLTNDELSKKFGNNHQGIVAEIKEYGYTDLDELLKSCVQKENVALAILDGLEDPHNLGAIMRTADATGLDGIIIPKNRSVSLNATVAKVSTGAIEYVKVCQVTSLVQTIDKLKKAGFWIIGLDMEGATAYQDQDYSG